MRSSPDNPPKNALHTGTQESELVSAIESSGYPLQGIVASKLLPQFSLVEEWGYLDDQTNENRSLDIHGFKQLKASEAARVSPSLVLLVECKRSRHPFVFFKQVVDRPAYAIATIDGIPNRDVWFHDGAGTSMQEVAARVLGLDSLPFVNAGPPVCASFSKAVASGKKVELSGSDPFNTVVLPLVKALRHTVKSYPSPRPADALYPALILCVAVMDAPMLVIDSPTLAHDPILSPWVRVVRHESFKTHIGSQTRFYALDAVHIEFFDEYLSQHVTPFANAFAERAVAKSEVLRFGGQVANLGTWDWESVAPRAG